MKWIKQETKNNIFNELIKPELVHPETGESTSDGTEWDCISTIDDYLKNDAADLLHRFFNHASDANKYLTASQQEDIETEFSKFIKS